jgi:hypothetical protein
MNPLASGLPDPEDKLDELRRAAECAPDNPAVHALQAKALSAKGLETQAQEEMRRGQQAQPRP